MAKKCIIQRNENGTIDVDVKNYDNMTALERAVKLNKGYPMDTASNGEPSLLYQFYTNELNMSPTEAEYVMTNMFSPEFGEWFGRWWEEGNKEVSRVVDINGQPKPVWSGHPKRLEYHYAYTNREAENRVDNDAFFPENKRLAQTYSNGGALDFRTLPASLAEKMSTGSVEPVFLNIRNEKEVVRNNGMVMAELLETGQAEGNDGFSGGSHAHPDEKVWSILDDSQVLYINGAEENDIVDEELPSEIVETGTKMAPNGNPSNLTDAQWEMVRTPEFIQFFGDWLNDPQNASQIVDENGEPMVVYHGTNKDFNVFKGVSIEGRNLSFFTPDIEYATGYSLIQRKTRGIPVVMGVFLNIRDPKESKEINTLEIVKDIKQDPSATNDGYRGVDKVTGRPVIVSTQPGQIKSIENVGRFSESEIIYLQNPSQKEVLQISIEKNTDPVLIKYYGENFMDVKVDGNTVGSMIVDKIDGIDNVVRVVNIQEDHRNKGYAKAAYLKYVLENGEILSGEFNNEEDPVNSFFSESAKRLWESLKKDYNVEVVEAYGYKRYKLSLKNNPGIENIYLQNETQSSLENIPQEVLQEITEVLTEKGLVSQVNLMTPQELRQVLEEMDLSEEAQKQIEAWHGSPHLFNKFSTSAIGTGEGAQAFGWGLYFTDLKGIAENYAIKLSRENRPTLAGTIYEGAFPNADLARTSDEIILSIKEALDYIQDDDVEDYSNRDFESLKIKGVEALRGWRKLSENNIMKKFITDFLHILETADSENIPQLLQQAERDYYRTLREEADKILKNPEKYIKNYKSSKNLYNVSLHQGKTPEQYNWLEWDGMIWSDTYERIKRQAEIEKTLNEILPIIDNANDGKELYESISIILNSEKEASLFLLRAGIDGVKYPAESLSRGATSDTARGFNYVVFDENAVTINEVVQFQNDLEKAGLKLTPNGFYRPSNRQIYLNSENPNILETTIHEFAHPFLQYLRDSKPAHYQAGVKLLQSNQEEAQSYIDFVKQTQPALKEGTQAFYEEVLAQIVGDNGAKLVNTTNKNSIQEWLENLWETIGRLIGITKYTPDEISRMTLEEFSNSVVAEMMDRQEFNNIQIQEREFIPSQLFEELSQQPFLNQEQALDIYQSIYTDDLNHWKDADLNC